MVNIFHLDENPRICAEWYFDKHVVKIILEIAQMTSTAVHQFKDAENLYKLHNLYKPTHVNHPMSIWVRESRKNFEWTLLLGFFLVKEHLYRYPKSKRHASFKILKTCWKLRECIPGGNKTVPPCVMPEIYHTDNVYNSYKLYYCGSEKRKLAKWTARQQPEWFQ